VTLALAILLLGQIGGKPISGGNPTPGTPQPDAPNVADRITVTGCVQLAKDAPKMTDGNAVVDARYVLTTADERPKVQYKLAAIESQMSPFAGMKVEISGEPTSTARTGNVVLRVEFVQKLDARCR
jgi:hypothetical protein